MNTGREGDLSVDLEALEDRHADALIFATVMTRPVQLSADSGWPGPVSSCSTASTSSHDLPAVLPDDRAGGAAAAELAAAAGHRRIALIGGERGTWPATARLAGYRDALARRGHAASTGALVRHGNWHADSGYEQARKVLRPGLAADGPAVRQRPDGAGRLRRHQGTRAAIPGDVSVIGYDDQHEIVALHAARR